MDFADDVEAVLHEAVSLSVRQGGGRFDVVRVSVSEDHSEEAFRAALAVLLAERGHPDVLVATTRLDGPSRLLSGRFVG